MDERIVVVVDKALKRAVGEAPARRGVTMGEFMRRAANAQIVEERAATGCGRRRTHRAGTKDK